MGVSIFGDILQKAVSPENPIAARVWGQEGVSGSTISPHGQNSLLFP